MQNFGPSAQELFQRIDRDVQVWAETAAPGDFPTAIQQQYTAEVSDYMAVDAVVALMSDFHLWFAPADSDYGLTYLDTLKNAVVQELYGLLNDAYEAVKSQREADGLGWNGERWVSTPPATLDRAAFAAWLGKKDAEQLVGDAEWYSESVLATYLNENFGQGDTVWDVDEGKAIPSHNGVFDFHGQFDIPAWAEHFRMLLMHNDRAWNGGSYIVTAGVARLALAEVYGRQVEN